MQPSQPNLLTISQFMHIYGIGRTKTYEEINQGRLQAKKVGRRTFIPALSANQWLENLPDFMPDPNI